MSAKHRLMPCAAGILGKHPGFGDFVSAGLPDAATAALGDWMQATLGIWRDGVGDGWQATFDAMPRIGFWIGPALCGGTALRGALHASRDRTGRRYPLVVAQAGGLPPTADPAPQYHAAADRALDDLLGAAVFDPRDVAGRLASELPAPPDAASPAWPTFWAQNPSRPVAALLSDLAAADHAHATACRSYWWFSDGSPRGAGVLACQAWPDASELAWLIAGGTPQADGDRA